MDIRRARLRRLIEMLNLLVVKVKLLLLDTIEFMFLAAIDVLVRADNVVQHRCQRAVQNFIIRMLEQQAFLLQGIKPVFY